MPLPFTAEQAAIFARGLARDLDIILADAQDDIGGQFTLLVSQARGGTLSAVLMHHLETATGLPDSAVVGTGDLAEILSRRLPAYVREAV